MAACLQCILAERDETSLHAWLQHRMCPRPAPAEGAHLQTLAAADAAVLHAVQQQRGVSQPALSDQVQSPHKPEAVIGRKECGGGTALPVLGSCCHEIWDGGHARGDNNRLAALAQLRVMHIAAHGVTVVPTPAHGRLPAQRSPRCIELGAGSGDCSCQQLNGQQPQQAHLRIVHAPGWSLEACASQQRQCAPAALAAACTEHAHNGCPMAGNLKCGAVICCQGLLPAAGQLALQHLAEVKQPA